LVSHGRLHVNLDKRLRKYLQFGSFLTGHAIWRNSQSRTRRIDQFDKTGMSEVLLALADHGDGKQPPSLNAFDQTFRSAIGRQTDVDVDFVFF